MILLWAVLAGLIAGWARARIRGHPYQAPELKLVWLVLLAVIPQLFAFHIQRTAAIIPDHIASIILVASQIALVVFAGANLNVPGFWALGLGLGLNLLVILANGGWMPISPRTASQMYPDVSQDYWVSGERFGNSKDLLIPVQDMRLGWLADRFISPDWFPRRVAFSPGDVLLAMGAFWLLAAGAEEPPHTDPSNHFQ